MSNTMRRAFLSLLVTICMFIPWVGEKALAVITNPLTVYSANPRYLMSDGKPLVILGAGQPLPGKKTEDYRTYLDAMAAHKVNYGRVWHLLVWDARNAYFPWARDGSGTANDGLPKFDLTHWDSNFWARLRDACAYAQTRNIYLSIMLFDECGLEAPAFSGDHRWDWHPFNPSNNVNGVGLPTSPDAVPEFYDLTNTKLKELQELYVHKVISETSAYPNVIYEICNEYTGPWEWEKHWIDFVSGRCSNILSVNRLGTIPSGYWTDGDIDLVKLHLGTTDASATNSGILDCYSKNRAIDYDETPEKSSISYTNYRNMLWAAFIASGHIHLENGYNSGAALDAVLHARNFIESNAIRFWEMTPANSLVTSTPGGRAYTLAKPGSEYVTYVVGSGGGSGSMTINLAAGTNYRAIAYNPSTGEYTTLSVNGNTVSGIPTYSSDIVIYVKASSLPESDTPSVSIALAVDKTSAEPGGILTYTITYKNTGDGAAASVVVSNPIPEHTTYVDGSATSGGTYDSASRIVRWVIPTIAPGGGGTVSFRVTVD